jgi:hypothetical protein
VSPVEDEDEVADGAETTQYGGASAQTEQEPEAEGKAEGEREGPTARAQEASHRLFLLHVGVASLSHSLHCC